MNLLLTVLLLLTGQLHHAEVVKEHDIHISICELRWNDTNHAFEVSVKIFIDDLELALQNEGARHLYIGTDREADQADDHIAAYLRKHLTIEMDDDPLALVFHGKEITTDLMAVWCYVEYRYAAREATTCVLSNDILLDVYDDQRNIMDIRMHKNHKAYAIFESGRSRWTYTF